MQEYKALGVEIATLADIYMIKRHFIIRCWYTSFSFLKKNNLKHLILLGNLIVKFLQLIQFHLMAIFALPRS